MVTASSATNTQDYTGRTVDVLAFQGVSLEGDPLLRQELADPETGLGSLCTGIQKLAQRWLLRFLSGVGTAAYRPRAGSSFMPRLRSGRLRSEGDVRQAVATAILEVAPQLRQVETDQDPLDERYQAVLLRAVSLEQDTLRLKLEVVSLAGTSRPIILPLPLLPH